MSVPLCPAQLLTLEGTDASAFVHAQFSSDVHALRVGEWQWSAWLDAQGRARAVFVLLRPQADRLLVWLPLGDAPALRDALRRFVFRSAVRIEVVEGWNVHRRADAPPAERMLALGDGGYALALPGGTSARTAWLAPGTDEADPDDLAAWRRADIAAALPLLPAGLAGEFVPQALDLERIDAIRFDKGCYPGQEVAARLHFRGGNKRRLHRVCVAQADSGAAVTAADGTAVGRILYSAPRESVPGSIALAVLADAAVAADAPLSTDGFAVTVCD